MHADLVMISMIINALENRVVGVCDFNGAYLNTLFSEFLCIKFEGEQVKIICEINSKYMKCMIKENERKILYLTLNKALYRCVQSAWLWYKLLIRTLLDI